MNSILEDELLEEKEVALARTLLNVFDEQKDNKRVTITYSELSEKLKHDYSIYIHHESLGPHLGKIAFICKKLEIPIISSIVVKEHSREPSYGYDNMLQDFGIVEKNNKEQIKEEKIKGQSNKEWNKLKNYLDNYYGKI